MCWEPHTTHGVLRAVAEENPDPNYGHVHCSDAKDVHGKLLTLATKSATWRLQLPITPLVHASPYPARHATLQTAKVTLALHQRRMKTMYRLSKSYRLTAMDSGV